MWRISGRSIELFVPGALSLGYFISFGSFSWLVRVMHGRYPVRDSIDSVGFGSFFFERDGPSGLVLFVGVDVDDISVFSFCVCFFVFVFSLLFVACARSCLVQYA